MNPCNKSLTILLVTNNYRPYSGGVVTSLDVLCSELQKKGHRPFIVTLDFIGFEHIHESNVIRLPSCIRFKYKGNHMAIPWRAGIYLKNAVMALRPDIIHVHHPFLLGITAFRVARSYNIPVVFTYHTQYESYLHYIPAPKRVLLALLKKRIKYFCQMVDMTIFPRLFVAQHVQKEYNVFHPYTIIPSAVDENFFELKKKHIQSACTEWTLLSVSRFAKEKNIRFLLRVMKLLQKSPIILKLVGYGTELNELKMYAYNELELSISQVVFIIKPARNILIDLYKNADLFIFSSLTETQGLVVAEALASGLPVIALEAAAHRESIVNGINGFLVASEYDMQEKIELLRSNKELYMAMKQEALKSAQNYHPQKYAQKAIDLYKSLLANRNPQ